MECVHVVPKDIIMSKKRKLLNASERCRICLTDEGCLTNLFDQSLHEKVHNLVECSKIQIIEDDNLPKLVCHVCLYKLDLWSEFNAQFIKSNSFLLKQLCDSESIENYESNKRRHGTLESDKEENCGNEKLKKIKLEERARNHNEVEIKSENKDKIETIRILDSSDDAKSSIDSQALTEPINTVNTKESGNKCVEPLSLSKAKLLLNKRSRTNERRKASTKRWVARKRALLEAQGTVDSDTDSMDSDTTKLSPVQKARAKSNAEKEMMEKQKRIARALKNLETNLTDKYVTKQDNKMIAETRNEIRTRSKSLSVDSSNCNSNASLQKDEEGKIGNENTTLSSNALNETLESKKSEVDSQISFKSNFIESKLDLGDATYIVSSTLTLVEDDPNVKLSINTEAINKNLNNDDNSTDKNTDIIDAVQLRRVRPKASNVSDQKSVERCLNIEVEGTDLDTLQNVQRQLAIFVEKGLKLKLFQPQNIFISTQKKGFCSLEEQIKTMVEKTIKRNLDPTIKEYLFKSTRDSTHSRTVSPTFVKEALVSRKFQPFVKLNKLNIIQEKKQYKINNIDMLEAIMSGDIVKEYENLPRNQLNLSSTNYNDLNSTSISQRTSEKYSAAKRLNYTDHKKFSSNIQCNRTEQIAQNQAEITNIESIVLKHMCTICHEAYDTEQALEQHAKSHKIQTSDSRGKGKMMRCRRCQEIVEAKFVKDHTCKTTKQVHKCFVCNSTFRTEKLLVRHLSTHDQSEFSIENITKNEVKKVDVSGSSDMIVVSSNRVSDNENRETISEQNITQATYTCFVCNKIFTDEEILKDHLQKHCDDISEDEQNLGKDQFQCAICGESMDCEDALEAHVEKHFFDDDDDNPNLISITDENEDKKGYHCGQCDLIFNSNMLLEMHMQSHDEEAAIAEWEKQEVTSVEYLCGICDEICETEEQLTEHLNSHNENAHVCQLCDKPFTTLEDLQKHVANH